MIVPENATTSTVKSYLTPTMSFLAEKGLVDEVQFQNVIIEQIVPDGIAAGLGIQVNDSIQEINNVPVTTFNLQKVLQDNIGQEILLSVQRGEELIPLTATCPADNCILGVGVQQSA